MDCCNYGEYRGQAQCGVGAGWEYGYPSPPYMPYPHTYYHHAPDPYARYYHYDYSHHVHHADHAMPMDYGGYSMKDARARRALSRREQRVHPALQHFPLSHTPPLECGMANRSHAYCEPQMWPQYQMGLLGGNGWNGANTAGGMWGPRNLCSREQMRFPTDYRHLKTPQNHAGAHDGRSTGPYPVYDQATYNSENEEKRVPERSSRGGLPKEAKSVRENTYKEPLQPAEEKRPVVPLPAFQQAFGSTEIGKFAEAFSRAEVVHETDDSCDNFLYDSYNEWDGSPDAQWSQTTPREIKCEDNF